MPTANELFAAGRLEAAVEVLGVELRSNPADAQRRAFLFELLAFAGSYDRAQKQLDVLGRGGPEAELGARLYRGALEAERVREHMFDTADYPGAPPAPVAATLNGREVGSVTDADARIGARLELFAGGRYLWVPLAQVASVAMKPPAQLRDLRWAPAFVRTGPGFRGVELGEVLLPAVTPAAWRPADPDVRLGRATEWEDAGDAGYIPVGQKMLLVDGEPFPLLEVRELLVALAVAAPVVTTLPA
jgi:type VI secretion system protein ImpE